MGDNCKDILVVQNLSLLKNEQQSSLYLRSIIDRDNYESAKHSAGAQYKEIFGANYDDFSSRRQRDSEYFDEQFSTSEAQSALTLYTPADVISAWADCMRANAKGLFCWLEGAPSGQTFTLWIEWAPDVGIAGSSLEDVRTLVVTDSGQASLAAEFPTTLNPGRYSTIVSRNNSSATVRGTINGNAGAGGFATSFFVPKFVASIAVPPIYLAKHPALLIRQDNIHGGLQFGKVYFNSTVIIDGHDYTGDALGMHAPDGVGYAEFQIPRGAKFFKSVVGLARQDINPNNYGQAICRVYVDQDLGWSQELRGTSAKLVSIGIPSSARVLRLEVDGEGNNWSDHTTWGNPRFTSSPDD
jgi:hypothetical protein